MSDFPTLIVIDDHAPVRDLIVRILEQGGFPCRAAATLEEAESMLDASGDHARSILILPAAAAAERAAEFLRRHPSAKLLLTCVRPPACPLCPDLQCAHMNCLQKPRDFSDPHILLDRVRATMAK